MFGLNPSEAKTTALAKTIATKLLKNNLKAPNANPQKPIERQTPIVANGGTRATAIATPGKEFATFFLLSAYAAATPEIKATARSRLDGSVRFKTS